MKSIVVCAIAMVSATLALSGCGKTASIMAPGVTELSVGTLKAKGVALDEEAKFWQNFPTTVAIVPMKSDGLDYYVVRVTSKKLGFNKASKIGFPVLVKEQVQFKSNLYLGHDKYLYISDLGTSKSPRFYRVGTFGSKSIELREGDALKIRLEKSFELSLDVNEASTDETPLGLDLSMKLRAMPPMLTEPPLFTRTPKI